MDFGIIFANTGAYATPDGAITMGRCAEQNGFESVWTVEHPAIPKGYRSEYPYSRDGRMPGDENAPVPDPLVWLTWVGAHTTTLRLATGVMILPLRNPVVLAKECATLDMLTGGRFILGVGVGWLHEEFDAIGVGWDDRGAHTDDSIAALRALWTTEVSTHEGTHSSFTDIHSFPKPAGASIPIVVGGHSRPAARRAGRLGDGFFPADPRSLAELLPVVREAAREAGRDPDDIEITTGGAPRVETIRMLADAGVTRFLVPPLAMDPNDLPEAMARFADEVIAKV
ncbi:MAG: LLM class F420-dependent oxidoreductase [Acidimicrobiia bacterium]